MIKETLKDRFKELYDDYGLIALKFGTEYEEMDFKQMEYIINLTGGDIPIYVKIGGVDARNDINNLLKLGLKNFIAPMVESSYALKNFITTLKEMTGNLYPFIKKGINIETIYAFYNLDSIIATPYFDELDQVTLARSDFSRSINCNPDDDEVYNYMISMRYRDKLLNKTVVVGGTITPRNSIDIVKRIKPDRIDTRVFVVDATNPVLISHSVRKCLELERDLYLKMNEIFNFRPGFIDALISKIESRLTDLPLVYSSLK